MVWLGDLGAVLSNVVGRLDIVRAPVVFQVMKRG